MTRDSHLEFSCTWLGGTRQSFRVWTAAGQWLLDGFVGVTPASAEFVAVARWRSVEESVLTQLTIE